ncbi:NUDIX hydrolase [Streptomyces sp. H27-S2]|uniref:NUDIX hydrolase n=1 Tax=Streptomyces antarcticus TaxID=2996458 RepID=UPI00226FB5FA|nr:NUDIX hydrolase [Streptomyces sp. H27-S2]MCY0950643.1 NUDIX hydrolase [Streptomyces sp. H27-S2]
MTAEPDRPSPDAVRADRAARPAPLVTAAAVVLDARGRVLVPAGADPSEGGRGLPGGPVGERETPEEGLARRLARDLGLRAPVGRLLAVDSRPGGPHGRSLVVHVHLVGPLAPEAAAALPAPAGTTVSARWLPPDEAYGVLPTRGASRLRAALAALYTGSFAHLADGVPQPGSPAGLDPDRRAALEHSGSLDSASHRANRPKSLTAASVLFTGPDGGVLLVRPAYGRSGRHQLPGGGVDSDLGETPRAAARREVLEELGLDIAPGRLLAVNWSHKPGRPARIRFLYDGGILDSPALDRIRVPPAELLGWRTAAPAELRSLVAPSLRRQIKACLSAREAGSGPLELHAGRPARNAEEAPPDL